MTTSVKRGRRWVETDSRPKRVALHIADDCSLNRAKVFGILDYIRKRPQWEIPMKSHFPYMSLEDLAGWEGDGVIGNFVEARAVVRLRKQGLWVVNTASSLEEEVVPTVCVDSARIGRMAAEHLIERRFRRLAFAGFLGVGGGKNVHFRQREAAFKETAEKMGLSVTSSWVAIKGGGGEILEAKAWLEFVGKLKRPVGLFACADHAGYGVLKACRELGLKVPDEIAVIGVDDDQILCQMAMPRLSSIDPRGAVVGYKAAELMERLLDGKDVSLERELVAPGEIALRHSTDVIASSNMEIAAALRFINAHATEFIDVGDVLRVVTISRRSLERHFRETTGMGVYEAIRKAHIDHAKKLLLEKGLTIEEVARRSGFRSTQRFNEACLVVLGQSAANYREGERRKQEGPRARRTGESG